uniref:Uncharacterized protein n=1 Tax=Cucumis melo TaxID=3656 RepID=A0A9I9CYD0_CUCME
MMKDRGALQYHRTEELSLQEEPTKEGSRRSTRRQKTANGNDARKLASELDKLEDDNRRRMQGM